MKKMIIALAFTCAATLAHAETPEQRCESLADFAQGVAELRDDGVRLREVLEVVEERASHGMVDAYSNAAKIVYRYGAMSPGEVRDGMLNGCLETVRAERIKRGSVLKSSL